MGSKLMSTLESYFETLGRQTTKPFQDEQNLYLETEPDATKAVNENIDKQIQDTTQFFNDNINNYNATLQARSRRMQDLMSLTTTGIKVVNAYKQHQDYLRHVSELEDEDIKVQFRNENINLERETGRNIVELKEELAIAKREISETGSYTTTDIEGNEVTLYSTKNLEEIALAIEGLKTANGRGTVKEAEKYWNLFFNMAKTDIAHESGRYFEDLTPDELEEWYQDIKALYVQMWQEKDDRLSDGLIVTRLFPLFEETEKDIFSADAIIGGEAVDHILSEGSKLDGIAALVNMNNQIESSGSFSTKDEIIADGFLGDGGWWQQTWTESLAEADGNTERAKLIMEKKWKLMIDYGLSTGELTEEILDNVLTEWKFEHSDGSGLTNFADMNDFTGELAIYAQTALNNQIRENNTTALEAKLDLYEENLNKGIFMTDSQLTEFVSHSTLYERAQAIYQRGQESSLQGDKFTEQNEVLQTLVMDHAGDATVFNNINPKDTNVQQMQLINYSLLRPVVNRAFIRYYEEGLAAFKTEADAKQYALEKVQEDLKNGLFNEGVEGLADPNYDFEDINTVVKANLNILNKGDESRKGWLSLEEAHQGELPFAIMARNYFENGGEIPEFYRELAKLFPEMSAENLMYERLKAMGMIQPGEFDTYAVRVIPNANIFQSKLLTNKPTWSNALQFSLLNAEGWAEASKMLYVPESLEHFDGYGAFSQVNGEYSTDINLTELTLGGVEGDDTLTLAELIDDNPDGRFGIYGMKGSDLEDLLVYLKDRELITGEERFDADFQHKLLKISLKLQANSQLQFSGDSSYLNLTEFKQEDIDEFNRLIGEDGDNIPKFNNLEFLLPYVAKYRINTEL